MTDKQPVKLKFKFNDKAALARFRVHVWENSGLAGDEAWVVGKVGKLIKKVHPATEMAAELNAALRVIQAAYDAVIANRDDSDFAEYATNFDEWLADQE